MWGAGDALSHYQPRGLTCGAPSCHRSAPDPWPRLLEARCRDVAPQLPPAEAEQPESLPRPQLPLVQRCIGRRSAVDICCVTCCRRGSKPGRRHLSWSGWGRGKRPGAVGRRLHLACSVRRGRGLLDHLHGSGPRPFERRFALLLSARRPSGRDSGCSGRSAGGRSAPAGALVLICALHAPACPAIIPQPCTPPCHPTARRDDGVGSEHQRVDRAAAQPEAEALRRVPMYSVVARPDTCAPHCRRGRCVWLRCRCGGRSLRVRPVPAGLVAVGKGGQAGTTAAVPALEQGRQRAE